MKVASMTADAISQGLEAGQDCPGWLEFGCEEEAAILLSRQKLEAAPVQGRGFTDAACTALVSVKLKQAKRELCAALDSQSAKELIEKHMTEPLADKQCVPCKGGMPPLKGKELDALHKITPEWNVVNQHHLSRAFKFPDFRQALKFVNRVGELAEEQGHHPDILLAWGKAEITLWTHKVDGLTESDFIMAAKIDRITGK
jgi:4a-hydroxytetrahydrobiopterin dehydratase